MLAVTLKPGLTVNLNLLQTFVLVARYQSFKEASDHTGRSRSAISAQIRQLEEQLGLALFERTTRSVSLTAHGSALLDGVQDSFDRMCVGICGLSDDAGARSRSVAFACSNSLSGSIIPEILAEFRARHPGLHIDLLEMPRYQMSAPVLAGDVDFALGPVLCDDDPTLRIDVLGEEPFVAVVPRDRRAAYGETVSLRQLATAPLLLLTRRSMTWQALDRAARRQGLTLSTSHESINYRTLITMAEIGTGVAVLPKSATLHVETDRCVVLDIDDPQTNRRIGLISARGRPLSRTASDLMALIRCRFTTCAWLSPATAPGG